MFPTSALPADLCKQTESRRVHYLKTGKRLYISHEVSSKAASANFHPIVVQTEHLRECMLNRTRASIARTQQASWPAGNELGERPHPTAAACGCGSSSVQLGLLLPLHDALARAEIICFFLFYCHASPWRSASEYSVS